LNESKAAIYTFQFETAPNQAAILDAAYSLGEGESLTGGPYTLTGVITSIDTAWDPGYKNITVTIVCDGDTARPIQCYRLQGEGAEKLAVGDTITVTGEIKNYSGTIEFDAKCNLDKVISANGDEPEATEPTATEPTATEPTATEPDTKPATKPETKPAAGTLADAIAEASKLANKEYLDYEVTITGTITDTPTQGQYSATEFKFTVSDGTHSILCYYVAVTGGTPKKGDTVTVTGKLTAYNGTAQFDSKSTATLAGGSDAPATKPETPDASADYVTDPQTGVAYKWGLVNTAKGETYYLAGGMSGYYMATTTDKNAAVDVYLEATEGGYYLYMMNGSSKLYINMEVSGTHKNAVFGDAPNTVYTYNTEHHTLTGMLDGVECFFGTYGNNVTVGASDFNKYIATSYATHFYG